MKMKNKNNIIKVILGAIISCIVAGLALGTSIKVFNNVRANINKKLKEDK